MSEHPRTIADIRKGAENIRTCLNMIAELPTPERRSEVLANSIQMFNLEWFLDVELLLAEIDRIKSTDLIDPVVGVYGQAFLVEGVDEDRTHLTTSVGGRRTTFEIDNRTRSNLIEALSDPFGVKLPPRPDYLRAYQPRERGE